MIEERTEDQGAQDEVAPDFTHFGVVLERKPRKVFIPTLPHKYFFELRAPDAKGLAEIDAARYEFHADGVTIDEDGNAVGAEFVGSINAWNHLLAKCYAQITDFCLPYTKDDSEAGEVRFKAANEGRNSHNRNVYESLSPALAHYLEGALDWAAGESGGAREAFEALLNSSPSLVAD